MPKSPLVLLALVSACAGHANTTKPAGPCVDRIGSYSCTFQERSGTCGPIDEQIIVFGGPTQQMIQQECAGKQTISADNCDLTSDITCVISGEKNHFAGTISWSADGQTANGTLGTELTRSGETVPFCHGTYNVAYTKL